MISQESSPTLQFESISSLTVRLLYGPTLTSIHDYWKNHSFDYTIALTIWTFVVKVRSLLSNTLPHPRSKGLLISWLQSLSAVILELKKVKSAILFRN